jgi:hypothetical protein
LSVDAVHDSDSVDAVDAVTDRPVGADGGCVSAVVVVDAPDPQPAVLAVVNACAERFPAASTASRPTVYVVPQLKPVKVTLGEVVDVTDEPFS